MIIGVLKEIKDNENRVAITPSGTNELSNDGHDILIEAGAGQGSGFSDTEYASAGAKIMPSAKSVYSNAELILKVKEPIKSEYELLQKGQTIFTYLHLAADKDLTKILINKNVTAIAYETVQTDKGALPLLAPMSEVAGRMAVIVGAQYLQRIYGGRGLLAGGVPGVLPANVVIIGGGVVGINAAKMAVGLGANVYILDVNTDQLRYFDDVFGSKVKTLKSNEYNLKTLLPDCDLLVGAVLIPGAKAPKLVTREMLTIMPQGSVLVDVAVDQGGCVETSKPTTHSMPVFIVNGVIHYCVANMPGAVPRTSTFALSNATLPYVKILSRNGISKAIKVNKELAKGVNVIDGAITCRGVAEAHDMVGNLKQII